MRAWPNLAQPANPMIRFSLPATLFAALVMAGCAGNNAEGTQRTSQRGPITQEQIREAGITATAYDAVVQLRPAWLRTRGARSPRDPRPADVPVYVDGVIQYGSTDRALRAIPAHHVKSIDRLDARRAQNRYGMGHTAGAFVVELH